MMAVKKLHGHFSESIIDYRCPCPFGGAGMLMCSGEVRRGAAEKQNAYNKKMTALIAA